MSSLNRLYDYARLKSKDLEGNQAFWRGYMKKYMQSMARSGGSNVHRNKWFLITMFVYEDIPTVEGRIKFVHFLTRISNIIAKTFKVGHLRTTFTMDLLLAGIHAGPTTVNTVTGELNRDYQQLADKWHVHFCPTVRTASWQTQETWFYNWISTYNMEKQGCGHYEVNANQVYFEGSDTNYSTLTTACRRCATEESNRGNRVIGRNGRLILAEYAVTVHSSRDNVYTHDRRNPHYRWVEDRAIWVDGMWTPYGDLLGGYHSSRNRGFDVIDSPWFRQNRRAFGVELEVQLRSGDLETRLAKVHEAINHQTKQVGEYCYFERDGSIGEGFEIVTQPAGLDVHRDRLGRFLNDGSLKMGLRSHEGGACGLHVHVGREFLTQGQIYRVQSFLNDVRNEALIRSVARRYDNNYCRFKPALAKFTVKDKHSTERYEALNVTNADTIEFRIFRGSLRYESVIAAIEFVNSLLTFCTPGEVSLTQFTAIGFKQWLIQPERKAENRYLRSYLSLGGSTNDNEQSVPTQASAA